MSHSVRVDDLWESYLRHHGHKPITLQELVTRGFRRNKSERFWALRGVSFAVAPGSTLGIIGSNGAGKSTLLRLIGGVLKPDRGSIDVRGRIGPLLDLGSGFHPDLTGRENILISGVIGGLTRRQVRERFDSIVDFSELGDFIDSPVRTYSNGMYLRLAFSVATHIDAQILLLDEILAVGDYSFRRKCFARLQEFRRVGCTTILVAHDPTPLLELCDDAIWLNQGQLAMRGRPQEVLDAYTSASDAA